MTEHTYTLVYIKTLLYVFNCLKIKRVPDLNVEDILYNTGIIMIGFINVPVQ